MNANALRVWSLRRESAAIALSGFVLLGAFLLPNPLWLCVSLTVWGSALWFLWRELGDGAEIEWPTLLTLLRGWLVAFTAGTIVPTAEYAAAAYTVAVVLDDLDGRLARRFGLTTASGARLDLEIDALGILVASGGGVLLGKLPVWYLAIGLARYAFVAGVSLVKGARSLDSNRLRRFLAGCQMGFLAAALWPQVPVDLTRMAAYLFGGATLVMFARDWRFATSKTRE
ncbi:MAG TPA: CDP-alcohol phosphatidyltransferase family protein [Vicinamibacteria bacterium]|nr:CDP-alcohol phosphatidyltransferase family protein [Vicinamibacteria bacterium]